LPYFQNSKPTAAYEEVVYELDVFKNSKPAIEKQAKKAKK
jgi:hypothetical protein